MSQEHPARGEVFLDQDSREAGRRLELTTRINPRGPVPAYWEARTTTGRITIIREDRLADPARFKILEEEQ